MLDLFKMDMYRFYKKRHLLLTVTIPIVYAIIVIVSTWAFMDKPRTEVYDKTLVEASNIEKEEAGNANGFKISFTPSARLQNAISMGPNRKTEFADIIGWSYSQESGLPMSLTLAVVFIGFAVGREFTTRNIKNYVGQLGRRREFVFSKMLSSMAIMTLAFVVCTICEIAVYVGVTKAHIVVSSLGETIVAVGYYYILCMALAALFVTMDIVFKNMYASVVFMIGFWSIFVSSLALTVDFITNKVFGLATDVMFLLDYTLFGNISAHGENAVSGRGFLVALAYIAACTAVSCAVMKKRDVV